MINLIVFDPLDRFIEHLKQNHYRYREFKNKTKKGDQRIEIHDYKFGSYKGMIGICAAVRQGGKYIPLSEYK